MHRSPQPRALRRSLLRLTAPALLALGASCAAGPEPLAEVTQATTGAAAGHAQAGRIVNMGQPTAEELGAFGKEGYRLVLDMRTAAEDRGYDEALVAAELGMRYQNLGFREPETLTEDLLAEALAALRAEPGPVLLHCKSGNRSAAVWLAWRVVEEGVDFETALPEARAMGLRNEAYAEQVRAFAASASETAPIIYSVF